MLNPISTITVESALMPATSEPESATPDLFQTLIAELLTTTAAPDTLPDPPPVAMEKEAPVDLSEPFLLPREAHPNEPRSGDILPAPGVSRGTLKEERNMSAVGAKAVVPTALPFARVPIPPAHAGGWQNVAAPRLNSEAHRATIWTAQSGPAASPPSPEPDAVVQSPAIPQIRLTPRIVVELPEIVSTSEVVLNREPMPERVVEETPEREAPRETKPSPPPAFVTLVASIPDAMLNQIHFPDGPGIDTAEDSPQRLCTTNTSCALTERAYSDLPQAVGAVYDRPRSPTDVPQFALPETEVTLIKIEREALPAPQLKNSVPLEFAQQQRRIEHVATPVQTESIPSELVLKRPALATPPPNDLPSPPPGPPAQIETPVRDSQVNVAKPEVQTPQTHQTLVQPPVQPEITTARQLVQPQPIAITPESTANVPAVIGASPHFTQNGSQEKQDFRNDNGRPPIPETHSITPHVETAVRFQSHLMPMESPVPVAHVVELPPQLPLPVAHRVSIEIGEKDSRVVVTLHENRGDVSVKIHAPNEVLGAELRSSVGTLVEAFHREHISLANMDFTTGYTATSDDGQQHGNQPRQSFQNRARKFALAAEPTDQVEITSINLNA